ncbi:hypothetical protein PR202_gb07935 [Eleusine coracana subsp. coracana]|uniref:Uncharacterized protein n=1 Tax=Eleusine coracana subsp. coracana TaxID=191504 RepID=A0AAV5EDV1_ELECO|nr:hypothetical protein QOZ80_2BG0179230 [Eleusine coracana subsp. coracana]GJN20543.1 hypothetical protein PR202_gb07935 [Eleusine coracana subsp. coracana]
MADIALPLVEEFERGAKRAAMLAGRSRQELLAGDAGCRPSSASSKKQQGTWAAVGVSVAGSEAEGKLGTAADDGFSA